MNTSCIEGNHGNCTLPKPLSIFPSSVTRAANIYNLTYYNRFHMSHGDKWWYIRYHMSNSHSLSHTCFLGLLSHRDNPSVHVDTLKGFPVPQWMIDKIKIQMAAQRTDTYKSKSRSRSNTPSEIRTEGQVWEWCFCQSIRYLLCTLFQHVYIFLTYSSILY